MRTSAASATMTRPLRVTYSVSLPPAAGGSGSKRNEKYLTTALPNVGGRGIRAAQACEVSLRGAPGKPAPGSGRGWRVQYPAGGPPGCKESWRKKDLGYGSASEASLIPSNSAVVR